MRSSFQTQYLLLSPIGSLLLHTKPMVILVCLSTTPPLRTSVSKTSVSDSAVFVLSDQFRSGGVSPAIHGDDSKTVPRARRLENIEFGQLPSRPKPESCAACTTYMYVSLLEIGGLTIQ